MDAMGGKVAKIFATKGFGFIEGDDRQSYYFHVYGVSRREQMTSAEIFERLRIGDRVSFFREESERGPRAVRVKPEAER